MTTAHLEPFRAERYSLEGPGSASLALTPLTADEANLLGAAFAAMDPWAAYAFSPTDLGEFLVAKQAEARRWAIRSDGDLAGALCVRSPWLHGPYLQFLGLLPASQGQGTGAAVLAWMEGEARGKMRNLWLCVSATNTRAEAFYRRHGYTRAATLEGLVADQMDEILMRKRLA